MSIEQEKEANERKHQQYEIEKRHRTTQNQIVAVCLLYDRDVYGRELTKDEALFVAMNKQTTYSKPWLGVRKHKK